MGAFFGCIILALCMATAIAYGIELNLIKIAEQLERIANALESKKKALEDMKEDLK